MEKMKEDEADSRTTGVNQRLIKPVLFDRCSSVQVDTGLQLPEAHLTVQEVDSRSFNCEDASVCIVLHRLAHIQVLGVRPSFYQAVLSH